MKKVLHLLLDNYFFILLNSYRLLLVITLIME